MFRSPEQKRAIAAKLNARKRAPMSRRRDIAYGVAGSLVGAGAFVPVGRAIRKYGSDRKYTTKERIMRRGTFKERVADTLGQQIGYVGGDYGGGMAGALVAGARGGGPKARLVTSALGMGAGAVGGFSAARRWANKRRDRRFSK